MKKSIVSILALAILIPSSLLAAPVSWDFANGVLQPLRTAWTAVVRGSHFQATSTVATSTFPVASTTRFCIGNECRTSWGNGFAGIGTSSVPTPGQLSVWTSASTVAGIATGTLTETVSGLQFDAIRGLVGGNAVLSLTAGFDIPLTASTSQWSSFYNASSSFLSRANHTGTQLASTISDLTTTVRGLISSTATGLTYTSGTGVLSLTSGFTIPLTASTTEWSTFYTTPSTRITAGANCSWVGNTFNCTGGGGGGSISTSSSPTAGQLAFWTSPSALSSIATGTLTETVSGLQFDATRGLVGGSAVLSLSSGFELPLTASTSQWTQAFNWGNHATQGYLTTIATTTVRNMLSNSATGLTYNSTTGDTSLTSGFVIPTTTRAANWDTAFSWGNHAVAGYVRTTTNQTIQGEKIFDSVHTQTTGRLGVATPAFGGSRIGDSDLQAPSIDTRSFNLKDNSQNTLAALFGISSGNNEWTVNTLRSFTGFDHVLRISGLPRNITASSGAATLALVNEDATGTDVEGLDLFAQRYIGSTSSVASTSGVVILAEGAGQKLPFGFWYKRPGVQEYDRVYNINPQTFEVTFDRNINIPDNVYGANWNGSTTAPTKNAVFDKIESLNIPSTTTVRGMLSATAPATYNSTTGAIGVDVTGNWTGTFDGQEGTAYLSRANHTGTQLASTISDFVSTVRTSISESVTGLDYNSGTGVISLTSGFNIPTTASTTQWTTTSASNTQDVTLAGTPNYLTIAGQIITRNLINLASHVTGILGIGNGGTGTSTTPGIDQILVGNGTGYDYRRIIAGTNVTVSTSTPGQIQISATGGGGGSSQWTTNGSDIYYNTGFVGIGTTTPLQNLHVFSNTTASYLRIQGVNDGDNVAGLELWGNTGATPKRWQLIHQNDGDFGFIHNNGSGFTFPFTIKDNDNIEMNTNVAIGTTTTSARLSVVGQAAQKIATFFSSNGSTTLAIGAATTTPQHASSLAGFMQASLARITIGIDSALGYLGSGRFFGALTVNGLIMQSGWNQIDCSSIVGAVQIVADGTTGCDGLSFYEDTNSTLTSTTNGGNIYARLSTSAINDGGGVFLNAPTNGGIIIATSTPVLEVTARLHTVQNQGTTTQTFIGFTNIASAGTTYETAPTAGCFFTASSTQANWRAICRTSLGAQTDVDTGVASSTVTTGDSAPYRFLIETGNNEARFFIQQSEGANLLQVAQITTNVPNTVALNAGVHMGRVSGAVAVGIDVYDMNIGWRKALAR